MKLLSGLFVTLLMSMSMLGCGAPDDAPSTEPEVRSIQMELSSHGLTPKEGKTVLKLVDDICGDTWCEGDHNFHFDRIECTRGCGNVAGTCRLAFRIFPSDGDLKTGPTYSRSCQTSGFNGFASLVDTAANGYQSLNWEYYDSLSACINEVESQLPAL